jgi:hypothetical protein
MWGNSLGWGISAVIVAVTVGSLVWVSRMLNQISDPTPFSQTSGAADAMAMPGPPEGALPDDSGGNSGGVDTVALYHQAIDLYQKNPISFDRFLAEHDAENFKVVAPAVELLRQAAGKSSLGIFAGTPEEAVNYDPNTPLKVLKEIGDCANEAGLVAKVANDKDGAIADFQAAFSLGQRMADERLCYAELTDGIGLMDGAAIEMGDIAKDNGDRANADALNQFAVALSDFSNHKLVPIETVLSSIDQPTIEQYAGDLFWLARNSKERMWRVQSILALGRLKFNAGKPGDNRGAARVTAEIAGTDPDPVIKTAAKAASELTEDQYGRL